jgi:hypothetical protein
MLRNALHLTLVAACILTACATAGAPPRANLISVTVGNGATSFSGDGPALTTISPNGDGFRDRAYVRLSLTRPATVRLEVLRGLPEPKTVDVQVAHLAAGRSTLVWAPPSGTRPQTYRLRLTVSGVRATAHDPVVRVQEIDAGFERASYEAGKNAWLTVASDARSCTVQIFRVDSKGLARKASNAMHGTPVDVPRRLTHCGSPRDVRRHRLQLGFWPSGLYFARLTATDGRIGFAPFVLRPHALGEHRIAVVEPTFTWQAYNYRDADGDGVGDTWYANWSQHSVQLGRPYLDHGVPPHFSAYDLQFLRWLAANGHDVDLLADEDLDSAPDSDTLARAYNLIVFPGHHEYVTTHEYDLIQGFRDRGGNLMFLSANNFFWKVVKHGGTLHRVAQWRDLGRPEAALIGVQYRGNDEGQRRGPYVVAHAPDWLLEGTGLKPDSRFGHYGIEIDARAPSSPAETQVIAQIPDLFGPGFTAEMTFYKSPSGAQVFAAGAFTLAGTAERPEVSRLLSTLWERLAVAGGRA